MILLGWKTEVQALANAVKAAALDAELARLARPKTLTEQRCETILAILAANKNRQWSAREVSEEIGVTQTTVSDYLRTLTSSGRIVCIRGATTSRGQFPNLYKGI